MLVELANLVRYRFLCILDNGVGKYAESFIPGSVLKEIKGGRNEKLGSIYHVGTG